MGRYIVEFEQEGEQKAEYGTALLESNQRPEGAAWQGF